MQFLNPSDLLGPLVRIEGSFPHSLCTVINVCSCKLNETAFSKVMLHSSTEDTLATDHQKNPQEAALQRGLLHRSGTSEEHSNQFHC